MREQLRRLLAEADRTVDESILTLPRAVLIALWTAQWATRALPATVKWLLWLVSGQWLEWLEERGEPCVGQRDHRGHLIIEDTKYYRITKG